MLFAGFAVWTATLVAFRFDETSHSRRCTRPGSARPRLYLGAHASRLVRSPGRGARRDRGSGTRSEPRSDTRSPPSRPEDRTVAGYLGRRPRRPPNPHLGEFLGGIDSLPRVVEQEEIDLVIVAFSRRSDDPDRRPASVRSKRRRRRRRPRLFDVSAIRAHLRPRRSRASRRIRARGRRGPRRSPSAAFDIVGALIALTLLSPIFGLIALAIRLDDGGPIIFRQRRVGRDGISFTIFKFRTLRLTAGESTRRKSPRSGWTRRSTRQAHPALRAPHASESPAPDEPRRASAAAGTSSAAT